MNMLTKEESVQFITKVLGMQDPLAAFERNKHAFLDRVVSLIQEKIPFQGITLMAKPLIERRKPTAEEVKAIMMEGNGGICYDFNLFTYYLLKSLGYNVHLNICQVLFNGQLADNHLINLVTNLRKEGDMYLVDTGCARPTFRAIDLGFTEESQVYCDSFTRYKFVKEGNRIRRFHDCLSAELVSPKPMSDTKRDAFQIFYEFEIKPTTDHVIFNKIFDDIYTNPDLSVFHRSLRALHFPDGKLVVIVNSRLAIEKEQRDVSVTVFKDDEQLKRGYMKYFPQFGEATVKKAIANWRSA